MTAPPTTTARAVKKWKKFRDAYKARCQAAQLPCWRCGRTIDYHAPANHEAAFEADHADQRGRGPMADVGGIQPASLLLPMQPQSQHREAAA